MPFTKALILRNVQNEQEGSDWKALSFIIQWFILFFQAWLLFLFLVFDRRLSWRYLWFPPAGFTSTCYILTSGTAKLHHNYCPVLTASGQPWLWLWPHPLRALAPLFIICSVFSHGRSSVKPKWVTESVSPFLEFPSHWRNFSGENWSISFFSSSHQLLHSHSHLLAQTPPIVLELPSIVHHQKQPNKLQMSFHLLIQNIDSRDSQIKTMWF